MAKTMRSGMALLLSLLLLHFPRQGFQILFQFHPADFQLGALFRQCRLFFLQCAALIRLFRQRFLRLLNGFLYLCLLFLCRAVFFGGFP